MYKLSMNEYQFQNCTDAERAQIKSVAEEYADNQGIDWEYEYRWMTMPSSCLMLALIKYPNIDKLMTVRVI